MKGISSIKLPWIWWVSSTSLDTCLCEDFTDLCWVIVLDLRDVFSGMMENGMYMTFFLLSMWLELSKCCWHWSALFRRQFEDRDLSRFGGVQKRERRPLRVVLTMSQNRKSILLRQNCVTCVTQWNSHLTNVTRHFGHRKILTPQGHRPKMDGVKTRKLYAPSGRLCLLSQRFDKRFATGLQTGFG